MKNAGYIRCVSDEGLFKNNATMATSPIIGTWVDDLIGIGPDIQGFSTITQAFASAGVELEYRGQPTKALGMEITRSAEGIMLTQQVLIENLATTHGICGVRHSIPCEATVYERHDEKTNQKEFQRIVGGLLYISRST